MATVKQLLKITELSRHYFDCDLAKVDNTITLDFKDLKLIFHNTLLFKCGYPNEEIWMHYDFYVQDSMSKHYLLEITDSEWIKSLIEMNKVHSRHQDQIFDGDRHFMILFEDFVFECISQDFEIVKLVANDAIKINLEFLDSVIGPLVGSADVDEMIEKYTDLDSDNEFLVKEIITKYLVEDFESRSASYKASVRNALAYALLKSDFDFEDIFDSNLIAFRCPSNPRNFYKWIWEVIFPSEIVTLSGQMSDYQIVRDLNDPIFFGR